MSSRWFALTFFLILAACQPEPVVLPTVADPSVIQTELAATAAVLATATPIPLPPTWTPQPTSTDEPPLAPVVTPVPEETSAGKIYYLYNGDSIARVDADGTNPALILASGNPSDLTLSPDGTRLAYVADAGGAREVYICKLSEPDCTQTQPASRLNQAQLTSPAWSPDGQQIAFLAAQIPSAPLGVYIMRADGAGQRLVASTNTPVASELSWNAAGTSLFFTSEVIYGLSVTEGTIYNLTTTLGFGPDFSLAPNPSREELYYFKTRVNPRDGTEAGVLYRMNVDTLSNLLPETADAPVFARTLSWSHSGQLLLITTANSISVRDDQLGTSIQIVSDSVSEAKPVFSPDDGSVAYVAADTAGIQQVFRISRLEGNPIQLTNHQEGSVSDLIWAPG